MKRVWIAIAVLLTMLAAFWLASANRQQRASPRPPLSPRHETGPKHTDGDDSAVAGDTARGARIFGTTEPGAVVAVHPESADELDPKRPIAQGRADAQGRFSVAVPGAVNGRWVLHASLDGFVPLWDIALAGRPADLRLERGRMATHWVVDRDGTPIRGARVIVGVALAQLRFDRAFVHTGADGSARIRMTIGEPLRVEAEGYDTLYRSFPSLSSRRDLATYLLGPRPVICVHVVDGRGRPVAGAEVDYGPHDGIERFDPASLDGASFSDTATTDRNGDATLLVSPEVHYALEARRPASSRPGSRTRWAASGQEIELVLLREATIRGRVVPPLADAEIWIDNVLFSATDESGNFELFEVVPGSRTVQATTEDGREGATSVELGNGQTRDDVTIRLGPPHPRSFLSLRAIGKDGPSTTAIDWETIPGPTKSKNEGGIATFSFALWPGTEIRVLRPTNIVLSTTVSADDVQVVGPRPIRRFRVSGLTEAWFDHASREKDSDRWIHREEPGTPLQWTAEAPGRIGSGTLPAPRDGAVVTLPLLRTATVRGRLIDAAGEPVLAIVNGHAAPVNDVDGRFEIDAIRPGTFVLWAHEYRGSVDPFAPCLARRTLRLKPGEVRDVGDIVVPIRVLVRGRVLDERNRPVGGTLVILLDPGRGEIGRTRSTADGRFVAQVPKGKRVIAIAEHPDGRMAFAQDAALELVLRRTGRVVTSKALVEEETVTIETPEGTTLCDLWDGPARLPPGDYVAVIQTEREVGADRPAERRRFSIRAGETFTLK